MGLEVIAEGVETKAQKFFLAQHGCNAYQGYLFSPPLSSDEFNEFIQRRTI
jgi:EAL domain-containing protein (putative c-di-GMP-specific phosphodiesterase class I)